MFLEFTNWLGGLPQGVATFLGTLTGSSLGLVALLIGALFNSHLNRRRDDRLRREEMLGVRSALKAELAGISETLKENAKMLREPAKCTHFFGPDIAHQVMVIPTLLPKLALLDAATTQAVIGIHATIQQYCEALLMHGGILSKGLREDRRVIMMTADKAGVVAALNLDVAGKIDTAVSILDTHAR